MSKVSAYYHIVFATKHRQMTIPEIYSGDLYRFIWKEIDKLGCRLIRIGGIQNHIHILVQLNPSVALSTLVRNIKSHSSGWMHSDDRFRLFTGWAAEYFACTISPHHTEAVLQYIKTQREHHLGTSFESEIESLYVSAGMSYDARDMT